MLVKCLNCNNEFNKLNSQIKKYPNHFCSRKCSSKYKHKQSSITVKCSHCGKLITRSKSNINKTNNFCSHSCSAAFSNKGVQHNKPKLRICKECNSKYTFKQGSNTVNRCNSCYIKHVKHSDNIKTMTLFEYKNNYDMSNKHQSLLYARIRQFTKSWLKDLKNKPCSICGYDKHVELHHIKPISEFDDDATLGEINSSDNVIQLCPNCHWEVDNGVTEL